MEKSTILPKSIRKVRLQGKLLSPNWERQKMVAENNNLLEHKPQSRSLRGHHQGNLCEPGAPLTGDFTSGGGMRGRIFPRDGYHSFM